MTDTTSALDAAVLVKVRISRWYGFKKDKRVSDKVDDIFGTREAAGNFNKRLLSPKSLAEITAASSAVRKEHDRLTVPWCYDGVSLLPGALLFEYSENARKLDEDFDNAADRFSANYPLHKAAAEQSLNSQLYDPEDYPADDDIRHRFEISRDFFPVPKSAHFVVDLQNAHTAKLKQSLEKNLARAANTAIESLYERVQTIVGHVHERLSDPDKIFHDSLITNVIQLADLLPALNIFNDERLEEIHHRIRTTLLIANPDEIREDARTRETIARNAFDITSLLRGDYAMRQAA